MTTGAHEPETMRTEMTRKTPRPWALALCTTATLLSACGGDDASTPQDTPEPPVDRSGEAFDTLSQWRFFEGPMVDQRPATGVLPYKVAAPLWADHAEKGRFVVLPPGQHALMGDDEGWQWPDGTIFIKSFFFDLDRRDAQSGQARIIETRLLRLEDDQWTSYIYVWDDAQTEATRVKVGARVMVDHINAQGEPDTQLYLVPNSEECGNCHEINDTMTPLGMTTSQLNRDVTHDGVTLNQLEWLASSGAVPALNSPTDAMVALPDPFDPASADLESRARAYLHGNCGHCHREGGGGGRSGLRLTWTEDRARRVGICKGPVAAGSGSGGRVADIVPGAPEQSIILFRMASTDPEIKMPELPNLLPDDQGIDLITEWIANMEPAGCD